MDSKELEKARNVLNNSIVSFGPYKAGSGNKVDLNPDSKKGRELLQQVLLSNTYAVGKDGTRYSADDNDNPVSYTFNNNRVSNVKVLTPAAQRDAINKITDGEVTVLDNIKNSQSLTSIMRSIGKMQGFDTGVLTPGEVIVHDRLPGQSWTLGVGGETRRGQKGTINPSGETPYWVKKPDDLFTSLKKTGREDDVTLFATNSPEANRRDTARSAQSGWMSGGSGRENLSDHVAAHELAHVVQNTFENLPTEYLQKAYNENRNLYGKYSTKDLVGKFLAETKYFVPKLIDKIFGTHLVPTEDEWLDMSYDEGKFWDDMYSGDRREDLQEKAVADVSESANVLRRAGIKDTIKLFEEASENAGFDNVGDAIASISGYANRSRYGSAAYAEAFAEAYTDVLYNGNNAARFSKTLMIAYSDEANRIAEKLKSKKQSSVQARTMKEMLDALSPVLIPFTEQKTLLEKAKLIKKGN